MFVYNDKIVLITGAASGLGRALAWAVAKRGAAVILCDIDEQGGKQAALEITESGCKASFMCLDVADYQQFQELVKRVIVQYSRLDMIINNAGYSVNGEVRHVSAEDWQRITSVNFLGVVYGSKLAYEQMIVQGSGRIVNIASVYGLLPAPIASAYVATKHAVVGFSRSMHYEASSFGIQVHTVCPGFIQTPFFENTRYIGVGKASMLKQLTGKMLTPEVAAAKILEGINKDKELILFPSSVMVYRWLYRHSRFVIRKIYQDTVTRYRKLLQNKESRED